MRLLLRSVDETLRGGDELAGFVLVNQSRKTRAVEVSDGQDLPKRGKENQRNFRQQDFQDAARSQAVHGGHGKIENDDIGE